MLLRPKFMWVPGGRVRVKHRKRRLPMKTIQRLRMKTTAACALAVLAALALETTTLWPVRVEATTLDPHSPTLNFTKEGQQGFTTGNVLTLADTSKSDFVAFFADDNDAAPGIETDLFATFQVKQTAANNAEAGPR